MLKELSNCLSINTHAYLPHCKVDYLRMFLVEGKRFFTVAKDCQDKLYFAALRSYILHELDLPSQTSILQVIGDSAPYSLAGTEKARKYLSIKLSEKESLVCWGFTGQKRSDNRRDVNQLVNEWIDEDPSRGKKALANIVDFHTIEAIKNWKCSFTTNAQNFFLVYGEAQFGDDIISSDTLTDRAICLEGGVQSFRQIVNFLSNNRPIEGLYGLRMKNNTANFNEETGTYIEYFSAVEFLTDIFTAIEGQSDVVAAIDKFLDKYMKERQLFDPRRPDGGTKTALFKAAWKIFTEQQLWKKADLCHFTHIKLSLAIYRGLAKLRKAKEFLNSNTDTVTDSDTELIA